MAFLFRNKLIFFLAVYLLLFFCTCGNALFWDTVQFASLHPSWYYFNNFKTIWLPEAIDSGHPPAFGLYIAFIWKIFGRNLWATHMAMLPFIVILVVQAVRLGNLFFSKEKTWAFLCTSIILSEGVLLGQSILASPDVVLMTFFLLSINAVLAGRKLQLSIALAVLSIISTRGMMCVCSLYFFLVFYALPIKNKGLSILLYLVRQVVPFIPAAILAALYLFFHKLHTGWGGFNTNEVSMWAKGFEIVNIRGFARNCIILGWRLVDTGKLLTVFVFIALMIRAIIKRKYCQQNEQAFFTKKIFSLLIALFLVSILPLCFFAGLMGHRYLLPFTTILAVITILLLFNSNWKYKKALAICLVIIQLSGNFWVYPKFLSTGWDSTLAQIPYYALREDFKQFIKEKNIAAEDIGTQFPLLGSAFYIDLQTDRIRYKDALEQPTRYIWYSNVCNYLNDSADYYYNNFTLLKYERRGQVEMALFERK